MTRESTHGELIGVLCLSQLGALCGSGRNHRPLLFRVLSVRVLKVSPAHFSGNFRRWQWHLEKLTRQKKSWVDSGSGSFASE
jgi:hypothetical protein